MSGPHWALSAHDHGDISRAERVESSVWSAGERQRDLARPRSTRTVIPARGARDERSCSKRRAAGCARHRRAGLSRSTMVEEILGARGATRERSARSVPSMPAVRGRLDTRCTTVLRRWRFMLAVAGVASGVVGYLVAAGVQPRYEATTRLLVGPLGGEEKVLRASGPLAETYAKLATTRAVLDGTARRLGVSRADIDLRADANAVTRLLTLRARSTDARLAARVANTDAAALVALSTRRGAGSARAGSLLVVEPAVPNGRSVGTSALTVASLAALAGLLIAFVLALAFERTDDAITSAEDVEAATGLPCVGAGALAAKLGAERRQSLLLIEMHREAGPVAACLADALARQGSRVAVVDVRDRDDGTPVATAAKASASNGNGSTGHSAEAVLRDLEADADVVVLRAARLERSPSALTWARVVGGTVLVAERERTMAHQLRATVDALHLVAVPIVGTVLAEPRRPRAG
jgi:capsular polysaccharide biosynthesis protein